MILTCPECATGYFVDDAKIGPGGRTVRCKACGAQWRATTDNPLDLESSPEEGALAVAAPIRSDLAVEPIAADLPKAFRARAQSSRKMREAAVAGAVWAGLAVALTVILGSAALFRVDVVRLWPRTAAAYAAVGLPVNPIGLVIENVRAEPALRDGHAALAISGVIRNIEDRPIRPPALRITLLNGDGRAVGGKVAIPGEGTIPPGQSRHFSVSVLDPPSSTANLMVAFDRNARGAQLAATGEGARPHGAADAPTLRGPAGHEEHAPEPVEAAPLSQLPPQPADAPHAPAALADAHAAPAPSGQAEIRVIRPGGGANAPSPAPPPPATPPAPAAAPAAPQPAAGGGAPH